MVSATWQRFADEIARWYDSGRVVEFWWRDDDASRRTPELSRLLGIAEQADVPLALAVVPQLAESAALQEIGPGVVVIQHGVDHRNRATGAGKKTEFPEDEPIAVLLQRLEAGRLRLARISHLSALPVLAPPWNRISGSLLPRLPDAGFYGLSTFGARRTGSPVLGLRQVNTHVDIIDWKGGRGFGGDDFALNQAVRHLELRRTGQVDPTEPTGWLSHHAVHDEAAWRFLARLFEETRTMPGINWRHPADLFGHAHAN